LETELFMFCKLYLTIQNEFSSLHKHLQEVYWNLFCICLRSATESSGCSCYKETRICPQVWTEASWRKRKSKEIVRKKDRGAWSDYCFLEEDQRLKRETWL